MESLPAEWAQIVEALDFALQPIVNVHDGECLGFECLLRGVEQAGFRSIQSLFDRAHQEGVLHPVDLALRGKAVAKFLTFPGHSVSKLFFNLDIRVLDSPAYSPGATRQVLEQLGLSPASMCFEVSERQRIYSGSHSKDILAAYHDQGFAIAIDDYGIGFSGLKRLYECETDYVKIDGFFLSDITTSSRKRLFVSHIVGLAHVLGIKVIAEHVVTEQQFAACKATGCDFVQGYLVGAPVMDVSRLQIVYELVTELNRQEKRGGANDKRIVLEQVESVRPLRANACMETMLEAFRENPNYNFVPVVNALDEPQGVIWEPDIKEFVYSRYGRELMSNPAMKGRLLEYVTRCPVADLSMGLDKMLEVFSNSQGAELLLLTEGSRYRGFLSASALLVALNEKNLAIARDQSPLTRLPGNSLIADYMAQSIPKQDLDRIFVYFDLDNFKVFNDVYGFRQGDRAILLLADALKEAAHGRDIFLGHIGGDDLFAGFTGPDWRLASVCDWATAVVEKFNHDVVSLFSPQDRTRGHIVAADRSGVETEVPLLSVSCAVLALPAEGPTFSADTLGTAIARCKKEAKRSPDKLYVACLGSDDYLDLTTREATPPDRFAVPVCAS